ncbi:MAG: leucine-rich repeat protein [Rikenellaceae bacterium]
MKDWEFTDSIALVFPNLKVIPELALAGCAASFSVSAPNVTTIGDYAFVACLSMTSVSLPSATTIGEAAFELCIALTSVSLPLATTIGDYAFCECKALTSVSLPLATTIGDYAFVACVSLTSVSLPSATAIGVCAFRGCPNLESVSLPSVTSLGDASFQYSGLVNLELATNENCVITYFGAILFSSEYDDDNVILHIGSANSDLVSGNTITVNNDVYGMQYYTFKEIYIDGVKSEREGLYLSDFVEGFVPEGTTWTILDESATNEDFAGLRALLVEGVEIALDFPNLKVIPNEAFYGCKAAFGFSGAAVESIEEGYYVVDESASAPQQSAPLSVNSNELELSLDNINMESGVDVMRAPQYAQTVSALYGAFAYCTNVTSVSLPEATTIGNYAFYYCEALTEVSLPEATTIEDAVFAGCSALADVSLPKAITIEISAFNTCSSLTSVSLPEATMIGGYVFNSCEALTSVSLPEATTIGYAAFAYCSVLTDVSAPKAITIDDRAFGYCSDLAEISLPEATTIGMLAFYMCEALTSVSLPEATSIGAGAFISCTALTNLELATASGVVLQEMGEFIFATAEEIDGYFYLTDDSNGGNVTLNIGSANSEYISGNTITVNNDVYGMQYYTFKEIYIDGVKSEPDPEPEDDGYNSAYNSTIVVTPSMTSVSLDITIPQGVSKVYYYNATGKTAEDAKEYLLNKVESNSAYDYWNKSGVETISGLSYNTSYVLATISEAADGSYSELQSYEYTTNDIEFTSSASVSYATTYGAHSWSSSADAYSITLDVKFENGAVGYYFTELDSYFQKDYDGDGVISAIDCATSMVNNGFINSYFYYDSEGECTGSTRYAENYFVIIPVDANGAFGTPIALSKSTDESITEPEPEPEALSISMAVTELTTSSVTVEFTPSNDTDSYYAYICDEDFMTAQSEYVQIAYIGMNGTKFTGVNSLTASITSKAKRAYCIGVDDSGTSTTELYSMLCEGEVTE